MPKKTSTERVRAFRERERARKPPKKTPKSALERLRKYRARQRALKGGVEIASTVAGDLSSTVDSVDNEDDLFASNPVLNGVSPQSLSSDIICRRDFSTSSVLSSGQLVKVKHQNPDHPADEKADSDAEGLQTYSAYPTDPELLSRSRLRISIPLQDTTRLDKDMEMQNISPSASGMHLQSEMGSSRIKEEFPESDEELVEPVIGLVRIKTEFNCPDEVEPSLASVGDNEETSNSFRKAEDDSLVVNEKDSLGGANNLHRLKRKMDVHALIKAVFSRHLLWNRENPNHHHRFKLDKEWTEISKELGISVKDAQKKWKYLRDHFRHEMKKEETCRSAFDVTKKYTSNWPYFQGLYFLKEQFESGGTNESSSQLNAEDSSSCVEEQVCTVVSPASPSSHEDEDCDDNNSRVPSLSDSTNDSRNCNRKREADFASELLEIERKKLMILQNKSETEENTEDSDMCFFKSLLPHIRKLSPVKKLHCRMKILEVFLEFMEKE